MIEKILEALREMTKKSEVCPNTIRLHPADALELRRTCQFYTPEISFGKNPTVFGLKIIETTDVEKGTVELYNDEVVFKKGGINNDNKK